MLSLSKQEDHGRDSRFLPAAALGRGLMERRPYSPAAAAAMLSKIASSSFAISSSPAAA